MKPNYYYKKFIYAFIAAGLSLTLVLCGCNNGAKKLDSAAMPLSDTIRIEKDSTVAKVDTIVDFPRKMVNGTTLNPKTFTPNKKYHYFFPWKDVMACVKERLDGEQFVNHESCPKCGRESQNLYWIYFNSPAWTWKGMCGRAGYLSICTK